MAEAWLTVTQFAAAGLFLVLAAVLLAVKFNSRLNRAFAIFLLLRGATFLLQITGRLPSEADNATLYFDVARYFVLATPFVLLYFVVLYLSPRGGLRVRVAGVTALLLILVVESLYLLDHCVLQCPEKADAAGPLTPLFYSVPIAEGVAGLVLAIQVHRGRANPNTSAIAIVASAFTLLSLAEGIQVIATVWQYRIDAFEGWFGPARVLGLAGCLAAATALVILIMNAQRKTTALMLLGAAVVVSFTTVYQLVSENNGASQALSWTNTLYGTWRLLGASLVAYALVRHQFLDLDLRINWTISRGTVVAVLLATYLTVSNVAENVLDQTLGVVAGGLATAVMLLALKPLERLGDKVAMRLHPRGRVDKMDHEARVALFREQAWMVWADGQMARKERLLLDNLRERLGIEIGEAARIEHEAAKGATPSKIPHSLSTGT